MLSRLANIFRVPDLRNKVIFTLAVIALYQIGANVPVPGVNWARLQSLESQASSSGVLGFLNLFSGGALVRLAVFGLGRHALHHELHHHPAALHGDPQARGVAGPGRSRAEEDHPDDPLPDRGPRRHAVGRTGLRVPRPRLGAARHEHRPDPDLQLAAGAVHGAHPHCRHRVRHVAGRAHHPARHRPGHVDPDLRQRGGRHPHGLQGHLRGGWQDQVRDHHHRLARYCSWSSSSWTRDNGEYPSPSPDVWWAAECTAAARPTSRSRSTSPA